jgi:hypothetical protein
MMMLTKQPHLINNISTRGSQSVAEQALELVYLQPAATKVHSGGGITERLYYQE